MTAESSTRPPIVIDLWFDPVCPFTWVTSRWLLLAAEDRPVTIRWHLMSLAILNEGQDMNPEQQQEMADSTLAGRLLAAVAHRHGGDMLGAAYTSLGTRLHRRSAPMGRDIAITALEECGADTGLVSAIDDPGYDDHVRRSHNEGQDALGDTGGSPIVSIDGTTFFGPVLTSTPRGQEALDLFDAVTTLGRSASFSQIERPRSGPPDVG